MLPYSLKELDKLLPKGKPPKRRLTGIGRNCDLFQAMLSEVLRPRWTDTLGAQGWSEAWLEYVRGQNVVMFAPYVLPDSECRSIAKSCFRYWTRQYSQGRFRDIQTMRNGKRWHDDFGFDLSKYLEDIVRHHNHVHTVLKCRVLNKSVGGCMTVWNIIFLILSPITVVDFFMKVIDKSIE